MNGTERSSMYYDQVDSLLEDDRKYLQTAEQVGVLQSIDIGMDIDGYVYGREYELQFKDDVFDGRSERYVKNVLQNHFGSWFALLDGGSNVFRIKSFSEDSCNVMIIYISDEKIPSE